MSEMKFPVEVIDDGSGIQMPAYMAHCQCSNIDPEVDDGIMSDAFYVFWDHRHEPQHLHIQCFDCHQMYCPLRLCVPPPTAEVFINKGG